VDLLLSIIYPTLMRVNGIIKLLRTPRCRWDREKILEELNAAAEALTDVRYQGKYLQSINEVREDIFDLRYLIRCNVTKPLKELRLRAKHIRLGLIGISDGYNTTENPRKVAQAAA